MRASNELGWDMRGLRRIVGSRSPLVRYAADAPVDYRRGTAAQKLRGTRRSMRDPRSERRKGRDLQAVRWLKWRDQRRLGSLRSLR